VAAKDEAWRLAVEEDGLANVTVEALALGFGRGGDTRAISGFVGRWVDMLSVVERKGSQAIIESIVRGFYPRALASAELADATRAWLDANAEAPAALRRLVLENLDPIERALRAQARDAEDA
jgi:aminopeptidase N